MSNSDSDAGRPSSREIESTLQRVVRDALVQNEDITINLARSRAEDELDLDSGFLKSDAQWKQKSKDIITAAVEQAPGEPASQPPKTGAKRKSEDPQPAAEKKQRKRSAHADDEVIDEDEELARPVLGAEKDNVQSRAKNAASAPKSEEESELSEAPIETENSQEELKEQISKGKPLDESDDSDLSSLIDDPPPKKIRGKKATSTDTTSKASSKTSKQKAKADTKDISPDEEEIKRLQSWLVKCGMRKLWHRELAPYSTSKEKIRHLKDMLTDLGMTGRFSVEKARSIKEARELAAELEAAQEFNERWGHSDDEENGGAREATEKGTAPTRDRKARPKGLVVFSDSDGDDDG